MGFVTRDTFRIYASSLDHSVHINRAMRDLYDLGKRIDTTRKTGENLSKLTLSVRRELLIRQRDLAARANDKNG